MSLHNSSSGGRQEAVAQDLGHIATRRDEALSVDHSIIAANQLINTGASQRQLLDAAGQLLSSHPMTPPGSSSKLLSTVHDLLIKSQTLSSPPDLKHPPIMSSVTPVKHGSGKTLPAEDPKNNVDEFKFQTPKASRGSKPPDRIVNPSSRLGGQVRVSSTQQKSIRSSPNLTKHDHYPGLSAAETTEFRNDLIPTKNQITQHLQASLSSSLCTYISTWTNSSGTVCEPYVDTLANLQLNIRSISASSTNIRNLAIKIPYSNPGGILATLQSYSIQASTDNTGLASISQGPDPSTSSYVISMSSNGIPTSGSINVSIQNLPIGLWSGPTIFKIVEDRSTVSTDMPVVIYPKGFFVGNMYFTRGMGVAQFPVTQIEYGNSVYVNWQVAQSGYRAYLSYNSSSCPVGDPYSNPIVPPGFDVSNLGTGVITYPNPIPITKDTTFTLAVSLPGVVGSNSLSFQIQNTISLTRNIDPTFVISRIIKQLIPVGTVTAYNGANPPIGWVLCDGSNGTPDLRGRFVLAAGQGSGLQPRTLGATGGEESHILTLAEMPAHTHGYNHVAPLDAGNMRRDGTDFHDGQAATTAPAGSGQSHNNMPPYYTLTYIMKMNPPLVQLPLDGGFEDFSGSNTLAQYSPDNASDIFKFVSDPTYGIVLQAAYPSSLDPVVKIMMPLPATYTKSIWIKPSATFQTGGYQVFIGCMDPSGSNLYHYTCTNPNGGIRSGYRTPGHNESGIDTSSNPISANGPWVHVVETYQNLNGVPTFNVYINGNPNNGGIFTETQQWNGSGTNYICLGNLGQVSGGSGFNGSYRNLEIYDWVFSPNQALQLYNSQR